MIYETVITTTDSVANVHIAPMGITKDKGMYVIAPFKPSRTLENLLSTGQAIINMLDDVSIIAGCLTGRRDWPVKPAVKVDGRVLSAALSHAEVEIEKVEDDEVRPRFYCREIYFATHAPFRGFNRAQAAVLEAAILVSRLQMLPEDKIRTEIAYLQIAIDKTAGERERLAWNWLMDAVNAHMQTQVAVKQK